MKRWFQLEQHPGDRQLIRYLDGELPEGKERSIAEHLKSCWECRTRLRRIEEAIADFVDHRVLWLDRHAPEPAWRRFELELDRLVEREPEEVRRGFLSFCPRLLRDVFRRRRRRPVERADCDGTAGSARAVGFAWRAQPGGVVAVTLAVISLQAGVLWWLFIGGQPAAEEVLARTRATQQALFSQPLHQVITVRFEETRPVLRRRSGRMEIWSDTPGGRFSSRLTYTTTGLRHALWRPQPREEYYYDSASGKDLIHKFERNRRVLLLNTIAYSRTLEELEAAFLRWLETRDWQPVTLTHELAIWLESSGATLEARRLRLSGRQVVRLTARRVYGNGDTTEVTVVVDAGTRLPRLERIRLVSGGRSMQVVLVPDSVEVLEHAQFVAAVFEPRLPVRKRRSTRPPRVAKPDRRPTAQELAAAHIDALYALHRSGFCSNGLVRVVVEKGRVWIRGVVEPARRKQDLLASLQDVARLPFVELEISTPTELAEPANALPLEPGRLQHIEFRARPRMLAHDPVEKYLASMRSGAGAAGLKEEIRKFANDALAGAEASLDKAWALRRLTDVVTAREFASLHPRSRWLLEIMIRDHLQELSDSTARMRSLLAPMIRGAGIEPPRSLGEEPGLRSGAPGWRDSLLATFESVRYGHRLVYALFSDWELPPEAKTPQDAMRRLAAWLQTFDARVAWTRQMVDRGFSGTAELAAASEAAP